jgi:hypothetical protein
MDVTKIDDEGDDIDGEASEIVLDVEALVETHPVGTLLGALAVGYVLGGGLFTRLTRRLVGGGLRVGLRLAVLPALERALAGLARDLGGALGTLDPPKEPSTSP